MERVKSEELKVEACKLNAQRKSFTKCLEFEAQRRISRSRMDR
jgi:hypothetical protein